jgi:hypothetical protein
MRRPSFFIRSTVERVTPHRHVHQGLFLDAHRVRGRLVERYGADAGGGLGDDGLADLVHGPAGGEVHDGVGAVLNRHPGLFKLLADVGVVGGGADVGVDLGPQPGAYGERHAVLVGLVVVADDDGARGDAGADEFGLHPLGLGGGAHLVGDDPLAGVIELRFCHSRFLFCLVNGETLTTVAVKGEERLFFTIHHSLVHFSRCLSSRDTISRAAAK